MSMTTKNNFKLNDFSSRPSTQPSSNNLLKNYKNRNDMSNSDSGRRSRLSFELEEIDNYFLDDNSSENNQNRSGNSSSGGDRSDKNDRSNGYNNSPNNNIIQQRLQQHQSDTNRNRDESRNNVDYRNINNNNDHDDDDDANNLIYDRDDSLNDVTSFGKQTPFRYENDNSTGSDKDLIEQSSDNNNLMIISGQTNNNSDDLARTNKSKPSSLSKRNSKSSINNKSNDNQNQIRYEDLIDRDLINSSENLLLDNNDLNSLKNFILSSTNNIDEVDNVSQQQTNSTNKPNTSNNKNRYSLIQYEYVDKKSSDEQLFDNFDKVSFKDGIESMSKLFSNNATTAIAAATATNNNNNKQQNSNSFQSFGLNINFDVNNMSNLSNELLFNLKDTTIDEILLIPDANEHMDREYLHVDNPMEANFKNSKSSASIDLLSGLNLINDENFSSISNLNEEKNLIYQTPPASSRIFRPSQQQTTTNNIQNFNQNNKTHKQPPLPPPPPPPLPQPSTESAETMNKQSSRPASRNLASPSRIPLPKSQQQQQQPQTISNRSRPSSSIVFAGPSLQITKQDIEIKSSNSIQNNNKNPIKALPETDTNNKQKSTNGIFKSNSFNSASATATASLNPNYFDRTTKNKSNDLIIRKDNLELNNDNDDDDTILEPVDNNLNRNLIIKTSKKETNSSSSSSNINGAFKFYNSKSTNNNNEFNSGGDPKPSELISNDDHNNNNNHDHNDDNNIKTLDNKNNNKLEPANSELTNGLIKMSTNSKTSNKQMTKSRLSPFISIDKQNTKSKTTEIIDSKTLNLVNNKISQSNVRSGGIGDANGTTTTSSGGGGVAGGGSNVQMNRTNRNAVKKYRSGSTSALNVAVNKTNSKNDQKFDKKNSNQNERPRPATTYHEVNYSMDSDESSLLENLIKNPAELKRILKEGRMDKEQLGQLQENYLHLLEQYAEKENFIDTFRLGFNLNTNTNPTPNTFQGSLVTSKLQLNTDLFQQQSQQQQQTYPSSSITTNTNSQQKRKQPSHQSKSSSGGDGSSSLSGGSRTILIGAETTGTGSGINTINSALRLNSANIIGRPTSSSLAQTPTINLINNNNNNNNLPTSFTPSNNEIILLTNSTNNLANNNNYNNGSGSHHHQHQQHQNVFVITTSNRASTTPLNLDSAQEDYNSVFGGSLTSGGANNNVAAYQNTTNNNNNNSNQVLQQNHIEENIVVEPNSKLGILLQTKVLEDKMQSFITLMNEKQLTKAEQKQVFDSIKNDYESLLKNYKETKKNDQNGMLPAELDMDIDLNQELGKMKDLLNDIVEKMSHNLIEKSPSASVLSQEQRSSNRCSTASPYENGNQDELINQYNRLLDVFNNEPREKNPLSPETDTNQDDNKRNTSDMNNLSTNKPDIPNAHKTFRQLSKGESISSGESNEQQNKQIQSSNKNHKDRRQSTQNLSNGITKSNHRHISNGGGSNSTNKKLSKINGQQQEINNTNNEDEIYDQLNNNKNTTNSDIFDRIDLVNDHYDFNKIKNSHKKKSTNVQADLKNNNNERDGVGSVGVGGSRSVTQISPINRRKLKLVQMGKDTVDNNDYDGSDYDNHKNPHILDIENGNILPIKSSANNLINQQQQQQEKINNRARLAVNNRHEPITNEKYPNEIYQNDSTALYLDNNSNYDRRRVNVNHANGSTAHRRKSHSIHKYEESQRNHNGKSHHRYNRYSNRKGSTVLTYDYDNGNEDDDNQEISLSSMGLGYNKSQRNVARIRNLSGNSSSSSSSSSDELASIYMGKRISSNAKRTRSYQQLKQQNVDDLKETRKNSKTNRNYLSSIQISNNEKIKNPNSFELIDKEKKLGKLFEKSKQKSDQKNNLIKNLPVARAYEGSDSQEELETINHHHFNKKELMIDNVSVSLVKNEANKRSNNHLATKNENKPFTSINESTKPTKANIKTNSRTATTTTREAISIPINRMTEVNGKYVLNNDKVKKPNASVGNETVYSSDSETIVEKKIQPVKDLSKKEMMKRLTGEIESLKQEILKKHLNKMRNSRTDNQTSNNNDKMANKQDKQDENKKKISKSNLINELNDDGRAASTVEEKSQIRIKLDNSFLKHLLTNSCKNLNEIAKLKQKVKQSEITVTTTPRTTTTTNRRGTSINKYVQQHETNKIYSTHNKQQKEKLQNEHFQTPESSNTKRPHNLISKSENKSESSCSILNDDCYLSDHYEQVRSRQRRANSNKQETLFVPKTTNFSSFSCCCSSSISSSSALTCSSLDDHKTRPYSSSSLCLQQPIIYEISNKNPIKNKPCCIKCRVSHSPCSNLKPKLYKYDDSALTEYSENEEKINNGHVKRTNQTRVNNHNNNRQEPQMAYSKRNHNEYWSNTDQMRNKIKSSKSLENLNKLKLLPNGYYVKSSKSTTHQQQQQQVEMRPNPNRSPISSNEADLIENGRNVYHKISTDSSRPNKHSSSARNLLAHQPTLTNNHHQNHMPLGVNQVPILPVESSPIGISQAHYFGSRSNGEIIYFDPNMVVPTVQTVRNVPDHQHQHQNQYFFNPSQLNPIPMTNMFPLNEIDPNIIENQTQQQYHHQLQNQAKQLNNGFNSITSTATQPHHSVQSNHHYHHHHPHQQQTNLPANNVNLAYQNLIPQLVNLNGFTASSAAQINSPHTQQQHQQQIINNSNPILIHPFSSTQHLPPASTTLPTQTTAQQAGAATLFGHPSNSRRNRKVRYYIREYGDISTAAASDNELFYRRSSSSENNTESFSHHHHDHYDDPGIRQSFYSKQQQKQTIHIHDDDLDDQNQEDKQSLHD